jgi:hypothetical protein
MRVGIAADGDPDPISAGTAGEAALWAGSSAVLGMNGEPVRSPPGRCPYPRCGRQSELINEINVLVRPRGLEPPRVAPLAPQASASTNSATTACGVDADRKRPATARI